MDTNRPRPVALLFLVAIIVKFATVAAGIGLLYDRPSGPVMVTTSKRPR